MAAGTPARYALYLLYVEVACVTVSARTLCRAVGQQHHAAVH
jgi:hypothetical protein